MYIMNVLASGKCDFTIVEDVSKKSGNPYKCIRLKFNDYELNTPLFVNNDQIYIITEKLKED